MAELRSTPSPPRRPTSASSTPGCPRSTAPRAPRRPAGGGAPRACGTPPARDDELDKLLGLERGADDSLTKPFSPREPVARVRGVLRRPQGVEMPLVEVLSFDDGALEIDTVQHEVRRDGEAVELTPNEYRLLVTLARYPGRVYSRFELINHVQGYDFEGYERTIDAHVKNLRKKIEPNPKNPRYVETVFGVGYRLAKR